MSAPCRRPAIRLQPATLARLLIWPLRTASLLVILFLSLFLMILLQVPVIGVWLAILPLSWFWKYGDAVLEQAIAGAREPPALDVEMLYPFSGRRSLRILIICLAVLFISGAASYWLGNAGAAVVAIAISVVLPAILGLHGATGNVALAVSPGTVHGLIRRLGVDYAIVALCVTVLMLIATLVVSALSAGPLARLAAVAFLMYAWLAVQSLIGGLLFEHREESGIDDMIAPVRIVDDLDPHRERRRDHFIDEIYAEARNGAYANAWQALLEEIHRGEPFSQVAWIYPRVAKWPDPLIANRLAQEMLPQLLNARRFSEALQMIRDRVAAAPDFHARTSEDMFRLARFARDVGDLPTARALLRNYARFYPQAPERKAVEELARQLAR